VAWFIELKKAGTFASKSEVSIAVQGFGNVGYWFSHHAAQQGYKVVAISDSRGGVYSAQGLDIPALLVHKQKHGSLETFKCDKHLSNAELLELDVSLLVPSALENVITVKNAGKVRAKYILELANGPVTPDADAVLEKNAVTVIPDVLANAGGVTTSYFEWVQNLHGYYWSKDEVLGKLETLLQTAFQEMWQQKKSLKVSARMATYATAVKRVIDAHLLRGR
jgi:glutamate dehydrogenase/leucine dehydrogenase